MNASASDDRPRRIYNPVQRDAATFLETSEETGGVRTLAELEVAPGGRVTPHYHLTYSERFKVLEGRLTVEIDGVHHELESGDEAVAAVRSVHAWSNPGEDLSVVQVELRPGNSGFEKGLRVAYGLAADGLVGKNGVPRNPLQAALVLQMERYACPVATPRSNGSWGCWPSSLGGAASTANSSAATSDQTPWRETCKPEPLAAPPAADGHLAATVRSSSRKDPPDEMPMTGRHTDNPAAPRVQTRAGASAIKSSATALDESAPAAIVRDLVPIGIAERRGGSIERLMGASDPEMTSTGANAVAARRSGNGPPPARASR